MKEFTLEMSLKPFLRKSAENYESVAMELFRQWQPVTDRAEQLSVLLWTADGSEILEFNNNLDKTFDWGRYIGCINNKQTAQQKKDDPDCRHALATGKLFEEDTQEISYRTLKDIVATIKHVGKQYFGREISICNAFDPGPEFAVSLFKYKKHPEICMGGFVENNRDVVSCYSRLHADNETYAAFPDGIPEGTSFGCFLGRQSKAFLSAMNMDFLWLSNGFGFGNFAWCFPGALFDDEKFMPEKAGEVKAQMIEFWREFRQECSAPVSVRGSNLSAGRDLSADGVPLREIYDIAKLTAPPVNSPWGPLNFDFGSELCGWMTHAAGFPGDDLMFRYYVNDPWFPTKPYLLNYRKEPYDIYLPLSVSRINAAGRIVTASHINILTVDDCHGELPREATESLTPYFSEALRDLPDAPGPLVWLYPFDEYHDWVFKTPARNAEVFAGDLFLRNAVNNGLPLNTIVSTKDCRELPAGSIAVSPVPQAGSRWESLLLSHVENGGNAVLYGSLDHASDSLRNMLGIELEAPLSGEFDVSGDCLPEFFGGAPRICHHPVYSAGGMRECGGNTILASVTSHEGRRTLAAEASAGSGKLIWIRISVPRCHAFSVSDEYMSVIERGHYVEPAAMMLPLLKRFGWCFDYRRLMNTGWNPINAVSRHENGFFFSGFNFTTTTEHRLSTPFGAPALLGQDFILENDTASFHPGRSYHHECRIFIEQREKTLVNCYESSPSLRDAERWIWVRNVKDARLRLFLPEGKEKSLEVQVVTPDRNYTTPPHPVKTESVTKDGFHYYELKERVSGQILIFW
ncbi:MAG: hypothetical protein PHO93_01280 [Candidatus Saccharimonadaceae bacterium]|nr:hypothetical protein [Candidatus Saccharimonadaceae bacterium]